MKCSMCPERAEVVVSWPVESGYQQHAVCDSCGHMIWDRISTQFSGTEACMGFSIERIAEDA